MSHDLGLAELLLYEEGPSQPKIRGMGDEMMARQNRQTRWALVAWLSVGLGISAVGVAQGQVTTNGMFGSRTLGSSIGSRSDNLSTAGTPGSRLEQQQNVGQITGTERFLRDARQPGQFVGADSSDAGFVGSVNSGASSTSGMGLSGRSSMYGGGMYGTSGSSLLGLSGLGGRGMTQLGGQRGTSRLGMTGRMGAMGGMGAMGRMSRNVNLQTQMTVDFKYAQLPAGQIRTTVERRLNSSTRIQKVGSLQLEVSGRTATLRGVVATGEDRDLAVRMARLEPGISEVVDELTVASSGAPIPPPPQDQ